MSRPTSRTTGQTTSGGLGTHVSQYPGDQRLRNLGHELANTQRRIGYFGPIVHPGMSLRQAMATLDRSGGTIWFSEGIWFFRDAFTVDRNNVVFRAISPTRSKFHRVDAASSPMITFEGARCKLIGFEIEDSPSSTAPAIQLEGNRSSVEDCYFVDGYQAVSILDAGNCRISRNHVVSCTREAVLITGASSRTMVDNNFFESASIGNYDIYFGDSAIDGGAIGNNHEIGSSETCISIKTGSDVYVDNHAAKRYLNILDATSATCVQVRT